MYQVMYCSVIRSMFVALCDTDTSIIILTITLVESKLDIIMMNNNFVSYYDFSKKFNGPFSHSRSYML